ncbi:GAF domain-containing protein [Streptomyces sp. NPDC004111]|uniref:GAF domain-containing protein n=1 Tax=Streptomyces sp. NPDC004111 TaxID=3364690 RepID=UPI0036B2594B
MVEECGLRGGSEREYARWNLTSGTLWVGRTGVAGVDAQVTIRVAGELDVASVPVLARELHRAVDRPAGRTVLDLSRVTFCGTEGVGLLIDARVRAMAAGGDLTVARAHSAVLRPLQLCGETGGLRIAEEVTSAPLSAHERRLRLSSVSAALSAAFGITGAPMGNAQLYEPDDGVLRIVSQRGFHHPFLSFFESVADRESACGAAAQDRSPVLVDEVAASPLFLGNPALEVLEEAGVGSVVSVPITAPDGTLIGVVSVHRPQARSWTAEERRALTALARAAQHR